MQWSSSVMVRLAKIQVVISHLGATDSFVGPGKALADMEVDIR